MLHLPEADATIAVSIDGNGRRVACDPYAGTIEAVLECAQNLACAGAEPLGLTNCLNFGNPEKPAVAWQLDRSTQGLADACEALGVPVVGGNVSLYNETEDGPIYPTPVVGMVGELPDPRARGRPRARRTATRSRSAARSRPRSRGSELAKLRGELGPGLPTLPIAEVIGAIAARARRGPRRRGAAPPTTSATAALPARLPRSRSPAGVGVEADLDELVEARGCSGETALFGEGPGGFVARRRPRGARGALAPTGVDLFVVGDRRRRPDRRSRPPRPRSTSRSRTPRRAWRSLGERIEADALA